MDEIIKKNIGVEYDTVLVDAIIDVLNKHNATRKTILKGVGGSQDIVIVEIHIYGGIITYENETYEGIHIIGPESLVNRFITEVEDDLIKNGKKKISGGPGRWGTAETWC